MKSGEQLVLWSKDSPPDAVKMKVPSFLTRHGHMVLRTYSSEARGAVVAYSSDSRANQAAYRDPCTERVLLQPQRTNPGRIGGRCACVCYLPLALLSVVGVVVQQQVESHTLPIAEKLVANHDE